MVLMAHAMAMLISFTNVAEWLKIVSLLLAIGYTAWKWFTDYSEKQSKFISKKKK